MTTYILY